MYNIYINMKINNWNDKIEKKLLENIESCTFFENAHDDKRNKYKNILNITIFIGIIIMIVNTLLSSLASYDETKNIWLNITIAILSAISAGIGTGLVAYEPAKKLSIHTDIRDKYRHIIHEISWVLFLDRSNREENGYNFLTKICQEMMKLEIGEDTISIVNKHEFNKSKNILKRSGTMRKITNDNDNDNDCNNSNITNNIDINNNNSNIINNINNINNDVIPDIENEELISGLTEDENINFNLLFKRTSSIDSNLLHYQMQRFNR